MPPLSHGRLRDLELCPRKFWLRHFAQFPWPAAPIPAAVEQALVLGQLFHLTMQRHFEGVAEAEPPPAVADWWHAWQAQPVLLPPGRHLPELTLSIPLERGRLVARYDLLVLADDGSALIVDYKTGTHARPAGVLAADIQSRVYPFVLAAGGQQIAAGQPIHPAGIAMVYWQASDPGHPTRLNYSDHQHAANRHHLGELTRLAAGLNPDEMPPLHTDLAVCARCTFCAYCRPELAPDATASWDEELPVLELEPDE